MPKGNKDNKENTLPTILDPFRFADNAISIQGSLQLKNMQRLSASLSADSGGVSVDLAFGVDEQGTRFARGHFSTRLVLQCQRCLESFQYDVSEDLLLGIVQTEEEIDQLPTSYNPIIAENNEMIIQDIIEDELILSLPIVPMHRPDDCKVKLPLAVSSKADEEKENPFKVIELLHSKRNSK